SRRTRRPLLLGGGCARGLLAHRRGPGRTGRRAAGGTPAASTYDAICGSLAVEPEAEAVQKFQPGTALAFAFVGGVEPVSRQLNDGVFERFGREGEGLGLDVLEAARLAVEDVERRLSAEPRGDHAEAGVADRVCGLPVVRGAEEDGEAAAGVDRAA